MQIKRFSTLSQAVKRLSFSATSTPFLRFASLSALSLALCLSLNGCSIANEDETEQKIEVTETKKTEQEMTPVEKFIAECDRCVLGDISHLPELIATYQSTYTGRTDYTPESFTYQHLEPTLAFERCAQKAAQEGDRSAFDSMIIRPARVARIARYFYAMNNPTQGAFWLQRIINTQGEVRGLEVAGRIFIQDTRTIGVGVRLLEQSARLGNRNARQMLLGLMNPGSTYYQEITRNTLSDSTDGEDSNSADSASDSLQSSLSDDINATRAARRAAINDQHSLQNRAQAQQNISNLAAKQAEADAAFAADAANAADADTEADTADADTVLLNGNNSPATTENTPPQTATAPEGSAMDAINSTDGELNVPLEVYANKTTNTADTSAQASATAGATASKSGANTSSSSGQAGSTLVPNAQLRNQLQNQERLRALESRAEEAAQRARARIAEKHGQTQQPAPAPAPEQSQDSAN
ncbi:MAG TPA: hypothetical protein H9850_02405 [Candidatus Anaerobiospirillum pullistercoris]|uniref:Lipoprotein n=1 Tax=Candidatus Anaerobiospirillum pullistercoris TaxID=2838452 RepID=A0A9D2B0U7_9GAMM|nr:hypothetical protein [Candidatus Anaerobiospirillum pullistercoris]